MTDCWLCVVLLSSGCMSLHRRSVFLSLSPHTSAPYSLSPEARLWSPWILIHCSATECAQHRSENIWQALFIDPAGGQAKSTATRSSLFWSRVPQKSPQQKGAAKLGGREHNLAMVGCFFCYRTLVAVMGGESCRGLYKWKWHIWLQRKTKKVKMHAHSQVCTFACFCAVAVKLCRHSYNLGEDLHNVQHAHVNDEDCVCSSSCYLAHISILRVIKDESHTPAAWECNLRQVSLVDRSASGILCHPENWDTSGEAR